MSIKTTGEEFLSFYNDKTIWMDGVYHDDGEVLDNGEEIINFDTIKNDSKITINGGYVTDESGKYYGTFEGMFKKWKKNQNMAYITIKVLKDNEESLKNIIKENDGVIVK